MTADRSPDATADAAAVAGSGHLTDADRERIAVAAGWPDEGHGPLETAVEAIVARAVNEALTAARWEVHALRFAKEEGVLRGPDNFYNGVITSEAVLRDMAARRT